MLKRFKSLEWKLSLKGAYVIHSFAMKSDVIVASFKIVQLNEMVFNILER